MDAKAITCIKGPKCTYEPCHEKTGFLHMQNKGADQLHGNHASELRLGFATCIVKIHLLSKSIFCGCTALFVGNPKDRHFCDAAQSPFLSL